MVLLCIMLVHDCSSRVAVTNCNNTYSVIVELLSTI